LFLKANAMLNFDNMANAHFYAALIIHFKNPQKTPTKRANSANVICNWSQIKTVPITTAIFPLDITILVQNLYMLNYCHDSLALLLP